MKMTLNSKSSMEYKIEEYTKIKSRYPDRIPVIIEKRETSDLPEFLKTKYIVPDNLKIADFMLVIRKHIKVAPEKAIYLFVNSESLPANTEMISSVYSKHKDPSGLLFICVCEENFFG